MERSSIVRNCWSFVESELRIPQGGVEERAVRPGITISRESGTRAHDIAQMLTGRLNADLGYQNGNWEFYDRNLVERVLEDHHLPKRLAAFMPEDKDPPLQGLINELVGLHPSLWELFQDTCETILKLARIGNVVLLGRGAHILTRGLKSMVHVRLVGSLSCRACYYANQLDIPLDEAVDRIQREDAGRRNFIRSHFNEDINDPHAYDLTINTDGVSDEAVVEMILAQVYRM